MGRILEHFRIDGAYGWNQDWFPDFFMRMGGCAAVTACDSCVYLAMRQGRRELIPFAPEELSRANYLRLSRMMKRTLGPRMRGVDRLELYEEGFARYLRSMGVERPLALPFHGSRPYEEAETALTAQIDGGIPVPYLVLRHQSPEFAAYGWHWFLLMGYDRRPEGFFVQAVTYGSWRWLNFRALWDTGEGETGGLMRFSWA